MFIYVYFVTGQTAYTNKPSEFWKEKTPHKKQQPDNCFWSSFSGNPTGWSSFTGNPTGWSSFIGNPTGWSSFTGNPIVSIVTECGGWAVKGTSCCFCLLCVFCVLVVSVGNFFPRKIRVASPPPDESRLPLCRTTHFFFFFINLVECIQNVDNACSAAVGS